MFGVDPYSKKELFSFFGFSETIVWITKLGTV